MAQDMVPSQNDIYFGLVYVGLSSSRVISWENSTNVELDVLTSGVETNPSPIEAEDPPKTEIGKVKPNKSLKASYVFAPGTAGEFTNTSLVVVFGKKKQKGDVSLKGEGVYQIISSELSLSAPQQYLDFGDVALGAKSAGITVTITNKKTEVQKVQSNWVAQTGVFSAVPAGIFTLQPGASQAVTLTFSPKNPGEITDAIEFTGLVKTGIMVKGTGVKKG